MMKFEEIKFNKDKLNELKLVLEKNIKNLKEKVDKSTGYEKKLNQTFLDAEIKELEDVENQLKKV